MAIYDVSIGSDYRHSLAPLWYDSPVVTCVLVVFATSPCSARLGLWEAT